MMDTVYYEYIQNDRVKYSIYCSDGDGLFHICHLLMTWTPTVAIDIEFARRDIKHIVAMADKVSERLREFEAAGLTQLGCDSRPHPTRFPLPQPANRKVFTVYGGSHAHEHESKPSLCRQGLARSSTGLLALLSGCGDRTACRRCKPRGQAAIELVQLFTRKPLPDPVQSKDGVAYIPIDDTAFLVPEETWLRGYSRNSTDGLVANIALHASVPDVQPWSPERNDAMYWKAGPGLSLRIDIQGNRAEVHLHFHEASP